MISGFLRLPAPSPATPDPVLGVAFSPDGRLAVAGWALRLLAWVFATFIAGITSDIRKT